MKVEWREWVLSDTERQKFDTWMAWIMHEHTGTKDVRNQQLAWTPLAKPLSECVVTLFSTGGVYLKSDQPYDIANPHDDWTFREIPDRRRHLRSHGHAFSLQPCGCGPRYQLHVSPGSTAGIM